MAIFDTLTGIRFANSFIRPLPVVDIVDFSTEFGHKRDFTVYIWVLALSVRLYNRKHIRHLLDVVARRRRHRWLLDGIDLGAERGNCWKCVLVHSNFFCFCLID